MAQTRLRILTHMTVKWTGKEPLVILGGPTMAPDSEATLTMALWHGLGSSPAMCERIAAGLLAPVHKQHEWQEGDEHCMLCPVTRTEDAAERERVGQEKKKGSVAAVAVVAPNPTLP